MRLRHKVEIHRPSETRGTTGQVVKGYSLHLTRFAFIRTLATKEILNQATQIQNEYSHEVIFRKPLDILPKDKIIWAGRTFEITGPMPVDGIQQSRFIKVLAKERV